MSGGVGFKSMLCHLCSSHLQKHLSFPLRWHWSDSQNNWLKYPEVMKCFVGYKVSVNNPHFHPPSPKSYTTNFCSLCRCKHILTTHHGYTTSLGIRPRQAWFPNSQSFKSLWEVDKLNELRMCDEGYVSCKYRRAITSVYWILLNITWYCSQCFSLIFSF